MSIAYLKKYPLVYLATPYTRFRPGLEAAYEQACALAGKLMAHGVHVFCPIAHSHGIPKHSDVNALDHAFWMDQNTPVQRVCNALVIGKLQGWHESDGISGEIAFAAILGQPVYGVDPDSLILTKWGFE